MCLARDLAEAVAVADACTHRQLLDLDALTCQLSRGARRGVGQARSAAARADPAARSTWESRLRVFYVVDLGLPRPEVNKPIFDKRDGRLIGLGDLLDEEAGTVLEFDGRHHRWRRQHNADNVREGDFEGLGLIVTRADSLDLTEQRPRLARRIRSARERGLNRDRSKDLWTTEEPQWWQEQHGGGAVELTDEEKADLYGDA
jgi:hypothetical protein